MTQQVHTSTPGQLPALLSGQPAFERLVSVDRPNVGDRGRLFARLSETLDRGTLTNHGPHVKELETRLRDVLGVSHCIAVSSGTTGLQMAAHALGLTGEVIVPTFTFIATAQALSWIGLTPVFADVDPVTGTLDPADVERRITPRTSAILGVHIFGRACQVDALREIADRHNLQLFFDAAHAFRCSYRGLPIGRFGRCEVFSFHSSKFFNTLEGGAITTNDEALAARLRAMRDFGYAPSHEETQGIGTNGKMNEFSAAMGLTGLESLDEFLSWNVAHYDRYKAGVAEIPGLRMLQMDDKEQNNHQYIIMRVDAQKFGMSRDELMTALRVDNIVSRPYFHPPCHRLQPYLTSGPSAGVSLPAGERLASQVMAMPTGSAVTSQDVDNICTVLLMMYVQAPAVRQAVARAKAAVAADA